MDVPRGKSVIRRKKIRRAIYIVLTLAAVSGIYIGLSRLKPAAQTIDSATVVKDVVKRGSFPRNVRGLGTLVPENIVWVPATINGRVEKRLILPGASVTPDTVIIELSNPELQQQLVEAELQLRSAEADYNNRKVELEAGLLNQRAAAATVESDYTQAKLEAEAYGELVERGLYSELQYKQLSAKASELKTRNQLEKERLAMNTEVVKTQLAVAQSSLEQRRALYDLRRQQIADLKVRAGITGKLLELPVLVGEQVTVGTRLARVSDPTRLKAEIKVPETMTRDIQIGQSAEVDTRSGGDKGLIPGRVMRIDPGAVNGTRTVDVQLLSELPKGAIPDMNVEGIIELERLVDVLYIQRPAFGQEGGPIKLFKIGPDGHEAEAVTVQLGRTSVTLVEIVSGLKVGDQVIVSDTSSQVSDTTDRIRLN